MGSVARSQCCPLSRGMGREAAPRGSRALKWPRPAPPSPSQPPSPPSLTQLPRKVVFNFPSVPTASSAGGSQFNQKKSRTDAVGDVFLAISGENRNLDPREVLCAMRRPSPPLSWGLSRGLSRGLIGDPRGGGTVPRRAHARPVPHGPSPGAHAVRARIFTLIGFHTGCWQR